MIQFNKPSITELEETYLLDALRNSKLSGDGKYTKKVQQQFTELFGIKNMLLTTSGTDALELAVRAARIQPGDEVITTPFTFSSTANAFMLAGAKPVFVDIREDTWNIDETLIEERITEKTSAILPIDYAGVPCEIDTINDIAKRHGLTVIQDAAQSVGSKYKGEFVGHLTDITCFSFHETKNFCMGEGGATVFNSDDQYELAEILREKGTNRRQVLLGQVDKYTWHEVGSSYLPSDLLAALLAAQMDRYEEIRSRRVAIWNAYQNGLHELASNRYIQQPFVPEHIEHNGHMYNVKLNSEDERFKLVQHLKAKGIMSYICYVPLHTSPLGRVVTSGVDECPIATDAGASLLRLPLHAEMTAEDTQLICSSIKEYFA